MSSRRPSPKSKATWVEPRDAAGLILLRRRHGEDEVFLGRRHPKLKFAPGVLVGPGGALNRHDWTPWPHEHGRPGHGDGLDRDSQRKLLPLARAALREGFEEAGLVPYKLNEQYNITNDNNFIFTLKKYDFSALRLIARAITPRYSPIRFHSRFFLADGTQFTPRGMGDGELLDLGWYRVADLDPEKVNEVALLVIEEALKHLANPARRSALFTWHGARDREHFRRDP